MSHQDNAPNTAAQSAAPAGPGSIESLVNPSVSNATSANPAASTGANQNPATPASTERLGMGIPPARGQQLAGLLSSLGHGAGAAGGSNGASSNNPISNRPSGWSIDPAAAGQPAQVAESDKLGVISPMILEQELEQFIEDTEPEYEAGRELMQKAAAQLQQALCFKVDGCVITKAEKEFSAQLQVRSVDGMRHPFTCGRCCFPHDGPMKHFHLVRVSLVACSFSHLRIVCTEC